MKIKPIVEYYVDQGLTSRYPVNEMGKPIIEWGECVPGVKKERILYVKSITKDRLIFRQPHSSDEDLTITDFPTSLQHKEVSKVVLEFAPKLERIKPLVSNWGFEVVIG